VARKLLGIGALLSLASLAQVAPALASSSAFPGGLASLEAWPEVHGADRSPPGFTVTLVYNNLQSPGNIQISLKLPGLAGLSAVEVELTFAVAYNPAKAGGMQPRHWQEILCDLGHNHNDMSFTLTADLNEVPGGRDDSVDVTGFTITLAYGDPEVASAPLPGAMWLLGTGLLGLGCLGRRRLS
jgi:hypothetical protein